MGYGRSHHAPPVRRAPGRRPATPLGPMSACSCCGTRKRERNLFKAATAGVVPPTFRPETVVRVGDPLCVYCHLRFVPAASP